MVNFQNMLNIHKVKMLPFHIAVDKREIKNLPQISLGRTSLMIKSLNKMASRKVKVTVTQLFFNENDITISDEFDNFSLKDLSTGAKEQVMLL